MTVDKIQNEVKLAFRNVVLGEGIGLWQAQAIDDFESKEVQLKARERDEKTDWLAIPNGDLSKCFSSLSFVDAEGMRFLIPAFILGELPGITVGIAIYSLSQSVIVFPEQFKLFNSAQKRAIVGFLEFCLDDANYAFDAPHIKRALNEFWYQN